MTEIRLPSEFSAGLRAALITYAAPRRTVRRRWWIGGGLVALFLIGGTGAAIGQIGGAHVPGSTTSDAISDPVIETHTGSATVALGPAPKGATSIYYELTCNTRGHIDLAGSGSASCTAGDKVGVRVTSVASTALQFTAPAGMSWTVSARYEHDTPSDWATNANGDTYGAENDRGTPDLVAVLTTENEPGYAYEADILAADGATVKNPTEAGEWMKAHKGMYTDVPVYTSDGKTKIGVFRIGDWNGVPFTGPSGD